MGGWGVLKANKHAGTQGTRNEAHPALKETAVIT